MKPKEAYDTLISFWHGPEFKNRDTILKPKSELLEEEKDFIANTVNPLKEIIKKDATYACYFASCYLQKRWIEAEPHIMKNPKKAVDYFLALHYQFDGRWTEAEPYILQSTPKMVFKYFDCFPEIRKSIAIKTRQHNFPNGRWEEAEPIFAKEILYLHKYVIKINEEFPLLEKKVLENPDDESNPKCIFEYSSKILKRRWKEAEHIVLKHPDYSVKYCVKFDMKTTEENHNRIVLESFGKKLTSYQKKYLERDHKKKKMLQEYLKEQINNKTITKQTTVEELLN